MPISHIDNPACQKGRTMKRHSKRTVEGDDMITLLATLPAGPAFLDLKPRETSHGPYRDAARIRRYFSKALKRLNPESSPR